VDAGTRGGKRPPAQAVSDGMSDEAVALFIDLYLDADVYPDLVTSLRAEGFDVISALDIGHDVWDDEKQLAYAAENRRAILTFNTKHFVPLATKWYDEKRDHYGIIVSEQLDVGEVMRRLLRLLDRLTKDEMKSKLRYLSDFADRA
jgi:hypothetical protein